MQKWQYYYYWYLDKEFILCSNAQLLGHEWRGWGWGFRYAIGDKGYKLGRRRRRERAMLQEEIEHLCVFNL